MWRLYLNGVLKDKRTNRLLSRIEEKAVGKFTPEQATSCTESGGEENRRAQRPASSWHSRAEAPQGQQQVRLEGADSLVSHRMTLHVFLHLMRSHWRVSVLTAQEW